MLLTWPVNDDYDDTDEFGSTLVGVLSTVLGYTETF